MTPRRLPTTAKAERSLSSCSLVWFAFTLVRMIACPFGTPGGSAGVVNSYVFNSRWTFKKESKESLNQKLRFLAVSLAGCAVGTGIVKLCVDVFGWVDWLSNAASILVTVGFNFLGSKLFVFREKR